MRPAPSDPGPAAERANGAGLDAERHRRLVGSYQLVGVESITDDGMVTLPFGDDPVGYIAYTPEGLMMAVLARSDRAEFADGDIMGGSDTDRAEAFLSASAFAGRFRVEQGRIVHTLGAATFQNWAGTVQVREFELHGDELVLRTPPLMMQGKLRRSVVRLRRMGAAPPTPGTGAGNAPLVDTS